MPIATEWLTIREAAAELRVGRYTLDKAIKRGELRAAWVNKRDMRIRREWLSEWLESTCFNQGIEGV